MLTVITQHLVRRVPQALALLEIMWEGGEDVQPDVVTYNSVLKALGNAGRLDFAARLFQVRCSGALRQQSPLATTQDMRRRGIEPSITTYGTLLTAAADGGDLRMLRDTWSSMLASGMDVNGSCINAYVTGLAKMVRAANRCE